MAELIYRVPVVVLTGFLGSGKSTLLNGLLRHPAMSGTAVVVNELGEVGIDNILIERVTEGVTLLNSGCLCCAVRSDLEQTLQDLFLKRVRGVIPEFRRLVLETTGMARPGPVLQTILSRPVREKGYDLAAVITTVDAINGESSLRYVEARQQVAVADRLILTKTDLTDGAEITGLHSRLTELNPLAPITKIVRGAVDSLEMLENCFAQSPRDIVSVDREASRASADQGRGTPHGDASFAASHTHGIRADSFVLPKRLEWERLTAALKMLVAEHGDRLLRFKALVSVEGIDGRLLLQGVHHTLYPPQELPARGAAEVADCGSRLVFVSDHVSRSVFERFIRQLD